MARGLKKIIRSNVSEYADSDVVPLNPADSAPQTVGELLQTKRQEFGVDLRETAEYLNIRYAYLLSIEEGRVDDLPVAAYAMGFVRAYADYLGLDGPAIVERYKDETAELGDDVRLVFPSPLPEGKVPSGAIVLIGIVALALVYGGWVFLAQQNVKIAELVPALPEKFSSLLGGDESVEAVPETGSDAPKSVTSAPVQARATEPQPTPSTVTESQPQIAETPPSEAPAAEKTEPTDPTPAMAAENSAAEVSAAAPPQPPKPPAVASAEPRQFGGDNAGSRIMIKARIDSWVQIRDQDGEKLLTRVLRAGDSYHVPNRPGLLMETGNAGGLEITVDSAVIPDLGPKGAVRRDIALDADSLKAGASR
jgi:cytoskeleton protein RodZ